MKRKIFLYFFIAFLLLGAFFYWKKETVEAPVMIEKKENGAVQKSAETAAREKEIAPAPVIPSAELKYIGPRENIPQDAPVDYGFWSFAYPVPGVISRSGQPLLKEFQWLRNNGWRSVVNFRIDGDHAPETSDDKKIPGFKELGFNYLLLGMKDGSPPTDEQAKTFLDFVNNKENQPVHIHCRGGYGRAGTMMALFRYSVQNWPVEKAIEESRLFRGGISEGQADWLRKWAESYPQAK